MAKEHLWKRAVRRGIESVRREPRHGNFEQACELSAFAIERLRQHIGSGEVLSAQELDQRVSRHYAVRAEMEQRLAATWRQVLVTVRE